MNSEIQTLNGYSGAAMNKIAWGTTLQPAVCEACDWRYLLPQNSLPRQCPHCRQAELTPLENMTADRRPPTAVNAFPSPPELLIPFQVSSEKLARAVSDFANGIPFAPADLKAANLQSRLQRVYLPMWLLDSAVQATWQAETGFDYDVVSHQERYDQNSREWLSEKTTETRIRWEPRLGRLIRAYHNIPLPALEAHPALEQRLGAYSLDDAEPYAPDAIAESLLRLPDLSPNDAWPEALPALQNAASDECRRAAKAEYIREFRWRADYQDQNWTQLLLPVYATYYLDDQDTPQPILIHGQTGRPGGARRASMKRAQRLSLLIGGLAIIFFLGALFAAAASYFEEALFAFGVLGLALAFITALLALTPIVIVWQFNQRQKERDLS